MFIFFIIPQRINSNVVGVYFEDVLDEQRDFSFICVRARFLGNVKARLLGNVVQQYC